MGTRTDRAVSKNSSRKFYGTFKRGRHSLQLGKFEVFHHNVPIFEQGSGGPSFPDYNSNGGGVDEERVNSIRENW